MSVFGPKGREPNDAPRDSGLVESGGIQKRSYNYATWADAQRAATASARGVLADEQTRSLRNRLILLMRPFWQTNLDPNRLSIGEHTLFIETISAMDSFRIDKSVDKLQMLRKIVSKPVGDELRALSRRLVAGIGKRLDIKLKASQPELASQPPPSVPSVQSLLAQIVFLKGLEGNVDITVDKNERIGVWCQLHRDSRGVYAVVWTTQDQQRGRSVESGLTFGEVAGDANTLWWGYTKELKLYLEIQKTSTSSESEKTKISIPADRKVKHLLKHFKRRTGVNYALVEPNGLRRTVETDGEFPVTLVSQFSKAVPLSEPTQRLSEEAAALDAIEKEFDYGGFDEGLGLQDGTPEERGAAGELPNYDDLFVGLDESYDDDAGLFAHMGAMKL